MPPTWPYLLGAVELGYQWREQTCSDDIYAAAPPLPPPAPPPPSPPPSPPPVPPPPAPPPPSYPPLTVYENRIEQLERRVSDIKMALERRILDLEQRNTCLRAAVNPDEMGEPTCYVGITNTSNVTAITIGGVDGLSALEIKP